MNCWMLNQYLKKSQNSLLANPPFLRKEGGQGVGKAKTYRKTCRDIITMIASTK